MVDVIASFLHGLDRPLILWLIGQKPKHGYELMTEMKRLTGRKLKPSTLYPLLYWLEAKGYVAGVWVEKGKRDRRCYSLTTEGKALLGKVTSLFNRPMRHLFEDLLSEHSEKADGNFNFGALKK